MFALRLLCYKSTFANISKEDFWFWQPVFGNLMTVTTGLVQSSEPKLKIGMWLHSSEIGRNATETCCRSDECGSQYSSVEWFCISFLYSSRQEKCAFVVQWSYFQLWNVSRLDTWTALSGNYNICNREIAYRTNWNEPMF